MIVPAALAAAVGALMQHRYGAYVDIPVELVYFFQAANGVHLSLLAFAAVYSGTSRAKAFPRPLRVAVDEQERHVFSLSTGGAVTFACIAFYEHFPFGFVVGFAFFPLFWMARLVVVSATN